MFPQITVTIDKTRSAVFGDSEFWKFIESQFDVSIKKTNDARFCRIIGDGAKVIAAQKQIIAVVFQNSNNTTKQRRGEIGKLRNRNSLRLIFVWLRTALVCSRPERKSILICQKPWFAMNSIVPELGGFICVERFIRFK